MNLTFEENLLLLLLAGTLGLLVGALLAALADWLEEKVMREYGGIPRIALRRLLCRTMEDGGAFERVLDRLVDDGRVSRLYVSTSNSIQSFVFPPVRKIWGMVDGKLTWYKR